MYEELTPCEQLLIAIEFHLLGSAIPKELIELLGDDLISDITNPIVNKELNYADTQRTHNI